MKKIFGMLLVMVLLAAGFAGQARADWTADTELIRVVYNATYAGGQPLPGSGATNYEVLTDLGTVSSLIAQVNAAGGGAVTVGDTFKGVDGFGAASGAYSFGNLQVAYFAANWSSPNGQAWIAGSQPLSSAGNYWNTFANVMSPLQSPLAVGTTYSTNQNDTNGFVQSMEQVAPGTYNTYLTNLSNALATESRLTALATGGTVSQGLYFFNNGSLAQAGTLVNTANGALQIITNAQGYTVLEGTSAPVPVPPGILLLAPGLLGLFGIRRRKA